MSCSESVHLAVAALFATVVICMASYQGWRRLALPWRSISFVIYVVCTLVLIDVTLWCIVVLATPMVGPAQTCR